MVMVPPRNHPLTDENTGEVTETIIQGRRRGDRRCIHACNHEGWSVCQGPSDGAQEAGEHMLQKQVRAAWCPLAV